MICKTCEIEKQAAYFTLKQLLPAGIEHPIYHTTTFSRAAKILQEGFKARASNMDTDSSQNNAVCFTRNLCYSEKETFGFGNGEVIFVLDLNKLRNQFKTYPYNFHSRHIDPTVKQDKEHPFDAVRRKDPRHFEYEERVSTTPMRSRGEADIETNIPPKYIEAVLVSPDERGRKLWEQYGDTKQFIMRKNKSQYSLPQGELDFRDLNAELLATWDWKKATELLELGADIHTDSDSALRQACLNGLTKLVRVLLEHGADVHVQDDEPLIFAAMDGHDYVVRALLEHGADVHAKNDMALRKALIKRHEFVVNVLVEYGADLDKVTNMLTRGSR